MSEYGYDDRPRRHGSHRTREREPEYVAETTYVERGAKGAPVRDLVYRTREDSIEDIPRDFPPPGAEYRQTRYRETYQPRRARSVGRRDYDDRSDYGYARFDRGRGRYDDRGGYHSDDYDKPRHRRKSVVDSLKDLGQDLGLGGVIGAVAGHRSRSKSRDRSRHRGSGDRYDRRYSSDEYNRSRSGGGGRRKSEMKWEQAAKAALVAGAVEAFRSRKDPGSWTGEKGQRVATAALGAAGIDSLVDKDPTRKAKRHIAQATIGGLVTSHFANGARSQSRGRDGSRSRSQSRSGRSRSRSIFGRGRSQSRGREGGGNTLKDVAGAGAVLAAGKAIYDRIRSKSRSRRDRSRSVSSENSYVPSRGHKYTKSRSSDYDDRPRGGRSRSGDKKRDSSTDSESTTDMENRRKKLRAQTHPTYADANPYSAGVPPPPIGAPPARY